MNHDYAAVTLEDLAADYADPAPPPTTDDSWENDGVSIWPGLLNEEAMTDYEDAWLHANGGEPWRSPGGWDYCTPHRDVPALARLVTHPRIMWWLDTLLGEPAGVHLTLTGWVTTTRDWHADQYLNPPGVGGYYVAVWIALDDIHPDSGPFQYVPGSHRWPPLAQAKVRAALGEHGRGPDWPTRSEQLLTPLYEDAIAASGLPVVTYLPKRGDCLFWHSRLVHRGSRANVPGMERRALIAHYSGVNHRPDMPAAEPYGDGFVFPVDDRNGIPREQLTGGA
ncbi:MAG TPA: phytanoyl-CoA dioxygenase family protein [Acidimicrobiales bacterium]